MLAGSRLWGKEHKEKLSPVLYKKSEVYAYKNIASNLYEDLVNAVKKFGSNTAIITDDGQEISYTALLEKVDKAAWYLKYEKKVAVGDRVVLLLYNTLEFCVLLYATSKIGGVIVPVSTKYKPYELKMLLSRFPFSLLFLDKRIKEYGQILQQEFADAEVIVAEETLWFTSEDTSFYDGEATGWEDDLVMMFTSGTTSVSKGVILTNFNILNAISSYEELLSVSEKDKTIIATPIYHIIGIVALLGLFIHCGGTVYLQLQFRPERVLRTILEEKITFMHSTPTVFVMLMNYKEKYPSLPSWRISLCGSSNTPPSIIERLHTWLPNMRFCPVYGLTESSSSGSVFLDNAVDSAEIGASGKPVPGIYMKIIDEEGKEHGLHRRQRKFLRHVADIPSGFHIELFTQVRPFREFHNLFDGRQEVQPLGFGQCRLFFCRLLRNVQSLHLLLLFSDSRCKDEAQLCQNEAVDERKCKKVKKRTPRNGNAFIKFNNLTTAGRSLHTARERS